MSIVEAILWAVIIGLVGGSGVAMFMWFGVIGVAALAVFLLPILGAVLYIGSGGGSDGSATNTTRQSKGARER